MGRVFSMHDSNEKYTQEFQSININGRDHLGNLTAYGRIEMDVKK
jgi:hypothetical protein